MKNPLNIIPELFGAFTPKVLELATQDFCYDHIHEDYATAQQDVMQFLQNHDLESLGIQEIE